MNYYEKTTEELLAMTKAVEADPKNQMPPGHLYLYTPQARKKLDKIAWAITQNMRDKRIAAGDPPSSEGYSGSKQNRR